MSTGLRILVAIAAVMASLVGAADDCVSAAGRRPETLQVWDCDAVDGLRGLALERQNVKQGQAAVRWRNHPEVTGFSVPNVPQDWSRFNLLRLWIHNAKPVPARFMILIPSENPDTEGMDYWSYGVRLDFQGWKELILPIGIKGGTRSPRGWDQIDGLRFAATGWGNVPHPEADVLIDDVRLEYDPPRPGPRMTDEEFFDHLDLAREELGPVRRAVELGDLESAKSAFLVHMRSREKPKWWLDWRQRPSRTEPVEGGSEGWDYFSENIRVD